jgi:hypothetical protein
MRTAVLSTLVQLLAAALSGCINADPSTFANSDAGPVVTRPDVMRDTAEDVDPQAACRACFAAPEDPGPGCGSITADCLADMKCRIVFECGFRRDCWSLPTPTDIFNCGFPCFAEAGITSVSDPSVPLVQPLSPCATGVCQPACGIVP